MFNSDVEQIFYYMTRSLPTWYFFFLLCFLFVWTTAECYCNFMSSILSTDENVNLRIFFFFIIFHSPLQCATIHSEINECIHWSNHIRLENPANEKRIFFLEFILLSEINCINNHVAPLRSIVLNIFRFIKLHYFDWLLVEWMNYWISVFCMKHITHRVLFV